MPATFWLLSPDDAPSQYDVSSAVTMQSVGMPVDSSPTAIPAMTLVPCPCSDAAAMDWTGRWSQSV